MSLKEAIINHRLKISDIGAVITQIFNVTAYLHTYGILLAHLDLETVLIKRSLVKLSSFGVSLVPFGENY